MIKKNTKVIFKDEEGTQTEEEMLGGMPLSKGEVVTVHKGDDTISYEVVGKDVDCFIEGEDQIVNIVYTLAKQES